MLKLYTIYSNGCIMSWNDEKVEKLKDLWSKGHTASEIAQMLGDTTRNAVICLLYTSPSPRDLSTSRMPSSA